MKCGVHAHVTSYEPTFSPPEASSDGGINQLQDMIARGPPRSYLPEILCEGLVLCFTRNVSPARVVAMLASSLCSLFWTRPTVRGNTMLSPVGSSRGPLDAISKVLRARGKRWGQGGRADIKPKPYVAARSLIMQFAMEASAY